MTTKARGYCLPSGSGAFNLMKSKKILATTLFLGLLVFLFLFRTVWGGGGLPSAVQYLKTKTANPRITMALVAAGESAGTEYLKTRMGESAMDYEAPILALTASGRDPVSYPSENFIARLESFFISGQIGDPGLLNDDIFGVLALRSAGKEISYDIIQASVAFLKKYQNGDGSFPYGLGVGGDTNTTAAAIMALRSAGFSVSDEAISKTVSYLKKSQNDDGGFPYDPSSNYGASSDASSDGWVISAIRALGENPETWQKNGKNKKISRSFLSRDSDGALSFGFSAGSGRDRHFNPARRKLKSKQLQTNRLLGGLS